MQHHSVLMHTCTKKQHRSPGKWCQSTNRAAYVKAPLAKKCHPTLRFSVPVYVSSLCFLQHGPGPTSKGVGFRSCSPPFNLCTASHISILKIGWVKPNSLQNLIITFRKVEWLSKKASAKVLGLSICYLWEHFLIPERQIPNWLCFNVNWGLAFRTS